MSTFKDKQEKNIISANEDIKLLYGTKSKTYLNTFQLQVKLRQDGNVIASHRIYIR